MKLCSICGMRKKYILHKKWARKDGYYDVVACLPDEISVDESTVVRIDRTHNMPAHRFYRIKS